VKLFINGRFATQPMSGVQRYAGEMLRALDSLGRAGRLGPTELLSPPGARPAGLSHIEQRWVGAGGGHRWEQWHFARASRSGVALSLAMSGPLLHPRQMVVLHDAAVHRYPGHFSRRYAIAHRLLDHGLARRARIATVSHFSRRELAAVLGLAEADILVAPNGADHARAIGRADAIDRLGLGDASYFVMIGNLSPNKNVAMAVRALARIDRADVRLVVVGAAAGRFFVSPREQPRDPRLILAGRLDDDAVAALLASACALLFPSRYEGFGLPPLEAMAAGCPVLASDCAAAREVCGGAADHFAVDDDAGLARQMVRALDDAQWRAERIAAGRKRALAYRWADSAAIVAAGCAALGEAA
jgi:glycosyltransferase involved in cell wall biosynthesis